MIDHLLNNVFGPPMDLTRDDECRQACTISTFDFNLRINLPARFDYNWSEYYFFFNQNEYFMSEEILHYDDNAIVAAVGGSLGLFLGFSARGFLLQLLELRTKLCANKAA